MTVETQPNIKAGALRALAIALSFTISFTARSETEAPEHELLLIVGAPGEATYAEGFKSAAKAWEKAAASTRSRIEIVGLDDDDTNDVERIEEWVTGLDPTSSIPAWIVYIGHGTHTQKRTLLNLRGPDLSATTLSEWLDPLERTLVFIHGGSASAPFINRLSRPNRILMTATRSGSEINYARFGERFAHIIASRGGDSNQDGQVSLLEAFVATAQSVDQFYKDENRLASEHALIDDNGDSVGTPSDWFRGERLIKTPEDDTTPDGFRSRQIAFIPSEQEKTLSHERRFARDQLEAELESVRSLKDSLSEDEYYERLEAVLLKLGAIYLQEDDS